MVRALAKRSSPNGEKWMSRGNDKDERDVLQVVMITVDRMAKLFRVSCSDIGRCLRMMLVCNDEGRLIPFICETD